MWDKQPPWGISIPVHTEHAYAEGGRVQRGLFATLYGKPCSLIGRCKGNGSAHPRDSSGRNRDV